MSMQTRNRFVRTELRELRHECKSAYEILYEMSKSAHEPYQPSWVEYGCAAVSVVIPATGLYFAGGLFHGICFSIGSFVMASTIYNGTTGSRYRNAGKRYQCLFNNASLLRVYVREGASFTNIRERFGLLVAQKSSLDGSIDIDEKRYPKTMERVAAWAKNDIAEEESDFPDE